MKEYFKYIKKLKDYRRDVDFSRMYSEIECKRSKKRFISAPALSLAAAGALAVLLIGFFAYNNYFAQPYGASYVTSYVFESEAVDGNPVMAYVFSE